MSKSMTVRDAVVLAAGIGSRLGKITENKPKCLVRVAGKPILEHQIDALTAASIENLYLVVGHLNEQVRDFCSNINKIKITVVVNKDPTGTNNMYSLYLTEKFVNGKAFILMNGDVVCNESILKKLVESEESDMIVAIKNKFNEESMKIVVQDSGIISGITKTFTEDEAWGISCDIYKFSEESSVELFNELRRVIETERDLKQWTEVAIHCLLSSGRLAMKPVDIGNISWTEIDNRDDLALADCLFSPFSLSRKKLCFTDMDGTLYKGNVLIEGAPQTIQKLREKGIRVCFLSNNSSKSKASYVKKLKRFGIDSIEDDIILSTDGCIEHVLSIGWKNAFFVGTNEMIEMFEKRGIISNDENPEVLILGYDTELTYEKLRKAALLLHEGIPYLATHCDIVCPTPEGAVPDIGSTMALIEKATGRTPEKIFGKPSVDMVQHIINETGVTPDEVFLVGDRLYTDFKMAQNIGCDFVCVLSGETDRNDLENYSDTPALIANSLSSLDFFLNNI